MLTSPGTALRDELLADGARVIASSFDALSARIAEAAGSPILHLSGYCISGSLLGLPDVGLLTLPELVATTTHVCETTQRPLIVDADTGFGSLSTTRRAVRLLERAGAAG